MEYFCNNTDHVADTASTFRFYCPSSGVFPDIYEYPVKEYDGNYSVRFVSPVLDDTRKIINEDLTYWPTCHPSVKCTDPIPASPYYSNLVSDMTPPIKEYDKVQYRCYNQSLKLPNKISTFEIECGHYTCQNQTHLVYLVKCRLCNVNYVGQTTQTMRKRHLGHRGEIRAGADGLGRHFKEHGVGLDL